MIPPGPHYAIHIIAGNDPVSVRVQRNSKEDWGWQPARKEANGWWFDLRNFQAGYYQVTAKVDAGPSASETPIRSFQVR